MTKHPKRVLIRFRRGDDYPVILDAETEEQVITNVSSIIVTMVAEDGGEPRAEIEILNPELDLECEATYDSQ